MTLPKLDVKTPSDLVKPEKPEVLHGKPAEVPPGPDWQKLGELTIAESLGRFFRSIGAAVSTAVEVVSDIQKIVAGLKWVAIFIGIFLLAFLVIHFFL